MKTFKASLASACYTLAVSSLALPFALAAFQAWNHCIPTDTFRVTGWIALLAFVGAPVAATFASIGDELSSI